eukprot:12888273-Prorocentrum_lima.AAC.1
MMDHSPPHARNALVLRGHKLGDFAFGLNSTSDAATDATTSWPLAICASAVSTSIATGATTS